MTPDVEKCFGEATLTAILQFTANGGNATASLPMPAGLFYVSGSLMLVTQTGGLSIMQTNPAISNPVFTITGPGGSISAGNEIRFSYRVRVNCMATAGTPVFPLNITFNNQVNAGEITADAVADGVMFALRVRAKMDVSLSSVLSIGHSTVHACRSVSPIGRFARRSHSFQQWCIDW